MEKAIEAGEVNALAWMGKLYELSDHDPNYTKALEYYDRAAEAGHEDAKEEARRIRAMIEYDAQFQ